ncbi:MAG: 3-phosphoshikimate 1-carboxyvinyltransferase [Tissierellia bacterium]|nr:3-phosphoshikimate 1-carboxyvinyltransferase [Tissierellia bacterium]
MIKKVRIEKIKGDLEIPASKSLFHRYLIMASRIPGLRISYKGLCQDVLVTIEALRAIGSKIQVQDNEILINGFEKIRQNTINFQESGSSLRFILPYAFIEEGYYEFTGENRLPQRPIKDLLKELEDKNVTFTHYKLPFLARGRIKGAFFKLRADISSQYISSLMMAASFISDQAEIDIVGQVKSLPYINMTAKVMSDFPFDVRVLENRILINRNESKKAKKHFVIEGDWSNALLAISLSLLKGDLRLGGLKKASYQGDSKLVDILKASGADISWEGDFLEVKKSQIDQLVMDIEDNIDAFPVLSVLALSCKKPSFFYNIKRLRYKESDRVEAILDLHQRLGARSYVDGDKFVVVPHKLKSCRVNSYKDHRIVMAALVAAALADLEIVIEDFEAVYKSYPGFIKDMESIGVEIGDEDEV